MNTPIVNNTFRFVKWLFNEFLPAGYSDFQLDQGMQLKNSCIALGRWEKLADQELENLALSALLHNTGCVEGEYRSKRISKLIAKNYLQEQGLEHERISGILQGIDATSERGIPRNRLGYILKLASKEKFWGKFSAELPAACKELPDVFP